MSNVFLPTFLIGLREGLEAVLVVTILLAFLVKTDRRDRLRHVWAGVGAAVALSVGFAAILQYTTAHLPAQRQELFDAITSILAVVFVTWMIFWMRRAARSISGELRAKLDAAISLGPIAVVVTAFLAVAREGLETALIFFATVQGATSSWSVVAIVSGIAASALLGILMYRSAVRVNLTKFFTWTGVLLVIVAAGILKYGVHDLLEAGVLPGLNTLAFDISNAVPPTSWYAELLRGTFNFTPAPTVLETIAWIAYAVPVLVLFLLPGRTRATTPSGPAPVDAPSPAVSDAGR
ncbi:iron uptake transporter permease EfeU [Catellatospora citrea]|uniref:Iron transporter n=1 Tax=Catellatospora citrea TaxID=53366 RepID=A0A8J3KKL3_9ACTN|nr:iron uptake transporter permease EfeU [Catellatospora citrea]RKE12153.1 high-affinity iron transporter [Catellatospora citrea]GIF98883.1 iron transporter [Catellatospora citrea]